MKLQNNSKRMYQHKEYNLRPGMALEVPADIAKILLQQPGIVEYVDPAEAKKAEEEAAKKQAELEKENAALKAEIEKLKAEAKKAEAKKEEKPKK